MYGLDRKGVAAVAAAFMVIAAGVAAAGTQDEPPIGGTVRTASATTEPPTAAPASVDPDDTATASTDEQSANVTGIVQVDGAPIGGVVVSLVAGDTGGRTVDETLTSTSGRFTFSATGDKRSSYIVVASDPAGEHATTTSTTFTLDRDRSLTIAMPASAIVDGDVVEEGGADAVVGATVQITDSDGARQTTSTDAAGHFRFSGVAPGPVTITIHASGGRITVERSVTAGANRVERIVVPTDAPEPSPEPSESHKPDDGTGFTDQNEDPVSNS